MVLPERPFGSTGVSFPEIGFSAWAVGGDEQGLAAIATARELGVEVFDTTDVYGRGHSEELIGDALGDEGHVFTATGFAMDESGTPRWKPGDLGKALERSLERLGRDQVTLFQLHDPPRERMTDPDTYATLEALKDDGLTRWIGLSVHRLEDALAIKDHGEIDAVQLPVSILRQDTLDAIPELAEAGIGVIAREPLAHGFLAGKHGSKPTVPEGDLRHRWPEHHPRALADGATRAIEILAEHGIEDPVAGALAFVLAHEVSVVIPGTKTPDQVRQSAQGPQVLGGLPEACLQELYDLDEDR